ncbi:MAG: cysteine hydrolase [Actinobacteria bacterium]|nr:cysteine hydrolase [Actinomycetota bacterium]
MPTLLIIDIQNDYFPGGAFPLVGPEKAAAAASDLLAEFRSNGDPVVHLQHIWDEPDAAFMRPGTEGVEIHDLVAPIDGETLITKESPNGFLDTDLESVLRGLDSDSLVVAGMMTSMCVDATVRAASDLNFDVTLAHDACAAPDLEWGGVTVPAAQVHTAFIAALAGEYATLARSAERLD